MNTLNVIAGIAWDPTIRGLLTVVIGVFVLMGSVYGIIATNTGNRLGFLITLTGLMGWMVIMGLIWWIYGIGLQGDNTSWQPVDINIADVTNSSNEAIRTLDTSQMPSPEEFDALEPADD